MGLGLELSRLTGRRAAENKLEARSRDGYGSRDFAKSRPAMPDDIITPLVDVRSQPRAVHRGLRLLGYCDGAVSGALRARSHGGGKPKDFVLQRESGIQVQPGPCSSSGKRSPMIINARSSFTIAIRSFHPVWMGNSQRRRLLTRVRSPQANAYCERLVGTFRRECLDFLIPLSETHLRRGWAWL
jgi:transposase InsO family protein